MVNYTIIDHIGSISDDMLSRAYKQAYKLATGEEVFTIKSFCEMAFGLCTTGTKAKVRTQAKPVQVIVITDNSDNNKTHWWLSQWAERVDNITVLEISSTVLKLNYEDVFMEYVQPKQAKDSEYRRLAYIWGNALGWRFSAPLYRSVASEIDEMRYKRPDAKLYRDTLGAHPTVTNHSPESYLRSKAIASDKECEDFYNYFSFLESHGLLRSSLEAGYTMCSACGRPVHESQQSCDFCDNVNENYMYLGSYYDDSCRGE